MKIQFLHGYVIFITIIAVILFILWYGCEFFTQLTPVKSKIDNKDYKVLENYSCPTCAADQMAKIHMNIEKLFNHLKKKYPDRPNVARMIDRYNKDNVTEGPPNNGKDTSYSISKGRKIVFCLRSGNNPEQIHDLNLLMFVTLHELAHLASSTYGHNREFINNFKFLLIEGNNCGVYKIENYRRYPKEFCGMKINSNPIPVEYATQFGSEAFVII